MNRFKEIMLKEADSLRYAAETIDPLQVEAAIHLLNDTIGKFIFTGCGTSAIAAKKIVHTFSCIGRTAVFLNPSDAVHGSLGIVKENDIVIFLSKGGQTEELVPLINSSQSIGAKILCVSEKKNGYLNKHADITLNVKVDKEPDKFNMLATSSTLAVISLFDAICIQLMEVEHFSKQDFLLFHPSGDVGKRLASDSNI